MDTLAAQRPRQGLPLLLWRQKRGDTYQSELERRFRDAHNVLLGLCLIMAHDWPCRCLIDCGQQRALRIEHELLDGRDP